jgi:hypothetical protein
MSDEIEETRWLSYAELAEARGIDRLSAVRITRNRRWQKQKGNDGTIRVAVPRNFLEAKRRVREENLPETPPEISQKISVLETENASLREQVVELRVREGAALARADELRAVIDRLTAVPGAAVWGRLRELWRGR